MLFQGKINISFAVSAMNYKRAPRGDVKYAKKRERDKKRERESQKKREGEPEMCFCNISCEP